MNTEALHWEHSKHGQRKRRQEFHTIFSPGFFQCFIIQFLCLKAGISHYFVGNTRFNTRPLSNESLALSSQGAFLYGVITSVGLHLKYDRRIWHRKIWPTRADLIDSLFAKRWCHLSLGILGNPACQWLSYFSNELRCDSVCAPWLL